MSKVTIEINIDNEAFQPDPTYEVSRILRRLAALSDLDEPLKNRPLRDVDGNTVGKVTIELDDYEDEI